MYEQRIIDYTTFQELGLPQPVEPEAPRFTSPDRPFTGRFIIPGRTPDDHPGLTFKEIEGRTDVAWEGPKPTTATRQIKPVNMGSVRGHAVDYIRNQILLFESILEFHFANILMSHRRYAVIEDQPSVLEYWWKGKAAKHWPDFRTTLKVDGYRHAWAVKPAALLERSSIIKRVALIKARHIPAYADDMLVVTEQQITRSRAMNAIDINDALRKRNQEDCEVVADALRGFRKPVQRFELVAHLPRTVAVRPALLCLIYDGRVCANRAVRFNDRMVVEAYHRN